MVKIEDSWRVALSSEFSQPYFKELVEFVKYEYKSSPKAIFPPGNQIFRAFDECPLDRVKVVILGQDPYPTRGHAHGLCFSVDKLVRPLPKSLMNIYKELQDDLNVPMPKHGDLITWVNQGVLLLNTVLTVKEGQPDSHAGRGWEQFTNAAIKALNAHKKPKVFLLWGSKAIAKMDLLDLNYHAVLSAPHPSPLSAYRGFFGCKHFSKTNKTLTSWGESPIDWRI